MPDDPAAVSAAEQTTLDPVDRTSAGSFGRYRLLQPLGQGGMGEVWLAEQTEPAVDFLARALELGYVPEGSAPSVADDPQLASLRAHPRFRALAAGGARGPARGP